MGKQNMSHHIKKFLAVGFVLIVFALWDNALARAQEAPPEGIPLAASSDPAVQSQQEREQFVKEIRRVENLNRKYTKQIDEIKDLLAEKDEDFQNRMKHLEEKLAQQQDDQNKKEVAQEQEVQTAREL